MIITRIIALVLFTVLSFGSKAQLIAKVEMKDSINGICNQDEVYALYEGFDGQIEPKCSLSKEEMQEIINNKLQYLKDNPKYKGKGMLGVYINCEGTALQWGISVTTKSAELDEQILEIFRTFNNWEAGSLNGEAVDTRELFIYEITKGILALK